jgi:hypothetical protein
MHVLGVAPVPEALAPPRRQRLYESFRAGVKNLRARAKIAEKRYKPGIIAAAIISENFEHLAGIR